jgi:hypothetical protein
MNNQQAVCGTAINMIPYFFPTYLDTPANISVPVNTPIAKHAPIQETSSMLIGPIGDSLDCSSGMNGDAHPITAPYENDKKFTEKKNYLEKKKRNLFLRSEKKQLGNDFFSHLSREVVGLKDKSTIFLQKQNKKQTSGTAIFGASTHEICIP